MTEYRRAWLPGASWYFTVNLAEQQGNRLLVEPIGELRTAFRTVPARHPFHLEAAVILPDHLHCVWTLPPPGLDLPHADGALHRIGVGTETQPAFDPRRDARGR